MHHTGEQAAPGVHRICCYAPESGRITCAIGSKGPILELESLLGRKVDIASDGWVKPSIRESVYRDAIAL